MFILKGFFEMDGTISTSISFQCDPLLYSSQYMKKEEQVPLAHAAYMRVVKRP